MLKRLEDRAYWWLRVPGEPVPPAGAAGSLRTFRAGKNYLYLRMVLWAGTQAGAIIGLVFSLYFIREMEIQIEMEQAAQERERRSAAEVAITDPDEAAHEELSGVSADSPEPVSPDQTTEMQQIVETVREEERELTDEERNQVVRGAFHQVLHRVAPSWLRELPSRVPGDALAWIKFAESLGIVAFIIQFFWSLLAVRIDYKQRWYMVTDRSLRLRWGVVGIQETTMSFANLQQVAVKQGPLERLLKIADVEVRSAGGGSGETEEGGDDSMHRSVFRAVENAPEIRDMILERLKRYRQAGLGEPDDPNEDVEAPAAPVGTKAVGTLEAAHELLDEARSLRQELQR